MKKLGTENNLKNTLEALSASLKLNNMLVANNSFYKEEIKSLKKQLKQKVKNK